MNGNVMQWVQDCFAAEIGATLRRRFAPQPEVLPLRLDLHSKTTEAPVLDSELPESLIIDCLLNNAIMVAPAVAEHWHGAANGICRAD